MKEICRLTHCKNRAGDITSSLAWDDLTGMKLEAGRVIEARAKEVTYLREKRVYDKVHRQYAMRNKWKVIKTRWIDINKGDDDNPVYRSRLVGKEFGNAVMEGMLASGAATLRRGQNMRSKLVKVRYVSRAFFEAPAWRQVCVELPDEDITQADSIADNVGHVRESLYGNRDEAMNW